MKNVKSIWVAALLAVATVAFVAFRPTDEGDKRKQYRAMKREMAAYVKAQIVPVMKVQREKLTPAISLEDQARISQLREELKALREQAKAQRKELWREKKQQGADFAPSEADQEAMRDHRFEVKKRMMEATGIAARYLEQIRDLMEEVEEQKTKWRQDMRQIAEKHLGELPERGRRHHPRHEADQTILAPDEDDAPPHPEGFHRHHARKMSHKMRGMHHPKFMNPVGFLLWDPSQPMPGHDWEEKQGRTFGSALYPNPNRGNSNIQFEMPEAGSVRVEVLNSSGDLVLTVFDGQKPQGTHKLSFDTSSFESGVYLYRIITADQNETKRFSVE